eukprot:COSAG04_NODE_3100_length_3174_cov_6.725203_2_plen_497_part_00
MCGACDRGVSVCLRSLVGFDWGGDWEEFCLAVGKALWGSKWYEVMPGEPWSDLEDQIRTGKVKGSWPAARDEWGAWSSKLETVLLVAVPSESGGRNAARILPGRDDVYIIPRADCIPGFPGDDGVYYSNQNIQACLVLKPPVNVDDIDPATVSHVRCKAEYDEKGMAQLRLSPISGSDVVVDIKEGEPFKPKITQFTMTMAQPVSADGAQLMHHSAQQATFASQQLWLEDVARFRPQEMAAGIDGVEQQLTQAYTLAYFFTTIESAMQICSDGIQTIGSGGAHGITVCLRPPSELGWRPNAGGGFQGRVAELMGMDANDVQAMVILGVPNSATGESEEQDVLTLSEPSGGLVFFVLADDDVIYSKAHIAKVWTLEPTALADARQALVNIRVGKELKDRFEGMAVAEVEQEVQRLEQALRATVDVDARAEPQPEPESAAEVDNELEQVKAQLAQSQAQNKESVKTIAAKDAELAELRARLADAASAHDQAAEGVPPV